MIAKLKTDKGKKSYALRMMTAEPVFGTLQQYYGLPWINTRGINLANKVMLMAASAVNLKKMIKARLNNPFLKALNLYILHTDYIFKIQACRNTKTSLFYHHKYS